ncbi:MAG: TRAP transporter large permease subunit, partial [Rhodospirillales bacterium]|nr:TRAP transporter large permease subunit [Rhodospirillales bacterium]
VANLLAVSVGDLFMAAVVPGLALSGLYLLYIALRCAFQPSLAPPLDAAEGPASAGALLVLLFKSFVPPTTLIVMVLGSIFAGWATPTEASGVGAFGAFLLAAAHGRLTVSLTRTVLKDAMLTSAMVFFIFIGATALSYVFRSLGGDELVIDLIESLGLGAWGILLMIMAIMFVLGFFLDWIQITLIIVPVFAPVIEQLDFGAHIAAADIMVWFGILVSVNLQASFLTPPLGFALFILKGSAPPEVTIQHIYRGIVPFVLLQLMGVGLVLAFPEMALWLPRVVFN